MKDTTDICYFNLYVEMRTNLYRDFDFLILNFPFLSVDILASSCTFYLGIYGLQITADG